MLKCRSPPFFTCVSLRRYHLCLTPFFLVVRDRYWTIVYNRDTCKRIRTNKKKNRDI